MTMQVLSNGAMIDSVLPAETRIDVIRRGVHSIATQKYKVAGTDQWITAQEYFKQALLVKMYGADALQDSAAQDAAQ